MSATILLSPEAAEDIDQTLSFLAERRPGAAAELAERILATLENLAEGAFEGPEVLLADGRSVRSWAVPPYRVYYRRRDDALEVLRVYHQAREPLVR